MRRFTTLAAAVLCLTQLPAGAVLAAETMKLTDMHICCGGCTKGILKAVEGLTAVKVTVDQDAEEATIVADDKAAGIKALKAIAAAGYHASIDGKTIDMENAPAGKVTRLTVSNAHNCCGACTTAIKGAIKTVAGVEADTCKPKQAEFVIEGTVEAKAVVEALAKAGFHVSVK